MNAFKNYPYLLLIALLLNTAAFSQTTSPVLTASGNQVYCPGTNKMNIVTAFNITNPGTIDALYIQISEGYHSNQDVIDYDGTGAVTPFWSWDPVTAILKIQRTDLGPMSASDIIYFVNNVIYKNTSPNPTPGIRKFSITIGDASYLPLTGHYYRFVAQNGISWSAAKTAAENSTYFGLQGYLATITSLEEAQFAGERTRVTGWLGGSDQQTEGVWRWVTGPENGMIFWNGNASGSSPNFAYWNNGEPNNANSGENYAHITAAGLGIPGSWNDLPDAGGVGDYAPKGYVVEFGGMPGDPVLNIAASTTINILSGITTTGASVCGSGSVTLNAATSGSGAIAWYASAAGGTPLATGNSFTTPVLTTTTTYYAALSGTCSGARKAAVATVTPLPTVSVTTPVATCGGNTVQLQATPSGGTVQWYTTTTGGTPFATGNTVTSPAVTSSTTYYAQTTVSGCTSAREAVSVVVSASPLVSDENITFCSGDTPTLDAGVTSVTYAWNSGEATQTLAISQGGTYSVTVTNPAGCSAVKTFTVTELMPPVIASVNVQYRTVTVVLANANVQDYEFSIDGTNFQASNVFEEVEAGLGTITVRDRNRCDEVDQTFIVYIIPTFFSPNNDTFNDVFTIDGLLLYPYATVTIFDRYGKLITRLSRNKHSWDGTFDNNALPASDYWYIIKLDDTQPEIKGHFSLIR